MDSFFIIKYDYFNTLYSTKAPVCLSTFFHILNHTVQLNKNFNFHFLFYSIPGIEIVATSPLIVPLNT